MEIQTVNMNQDSPTPEPPQKSGHPLYILVTGILVIAALSGGWFANARFGGVLNEPIIETPKPTQPTTPETTTGDSFYYITADSSEGNVKTKIYRASTDFATADKVVTATEENFLNVLGNYVDKNTYVVYRGEPKLEVFNASTGKFEFLFDLPIQSQVRRVALSSDKEWLAYGLSTEGEKATSEIWLYNIETKQTKQLVKPTPVGLYQGYSIEGWRDGDSQLVISNLGGDAGATWGEIALVSVETGAIEPLDVAREAQKMDFLRGSLSSDGDMWLYQHCEQSSPPSEGGFLTGCPEGVELRTYNIASKQVKTIFRNLGYENNVDKALLRTIMSSLWQDNRTVIVALPGSTISISTDDGAQNQVLFSYDRTVPQNFQNSFLQLHYSNDKYVLYTRDEDAYIFNKVSKKTVDLNVASRNESFSRWLY